LARVGRSTRRGGEAGLRYINPTKQAYNDQASVRRVLYTPEG
jgi:hypothetical protein